MAEHEAEAADVDDGGVAFWRAGRAGRGSRSPTCGYMIEEVVALDGVEDGEGDGAGQRASAEGGAVHAGVDGAGGLFGAEHARRGGCRRRAAWRG